MRNKYKYLVKENPNLEWLTLERTNSNAISTLYQILLIGI